ncbi:hypothetical protein HYH03_017032 [Edaphochlamys debaryana]|uniref:U-box domain-containing protein n=1 Tax=Edaphochlamys debaryana TaxID=47281 RepID=A0A836BPB2_9CHLO|nr:hypothetical protein HYH03_017032 [Edaphochlamys debaryana]|eukprot:KAG2484151.1 hypothetical protein HYH03_017032 [Edaphochlamys debaryana]
MNVLRLGGESSADDEDAGSHRSSSKDSGSATGSSGSSNGSDRGRAPPRCVPLSFACPITRCVMRDPVVLVETGCSFERGAIECHLYARNTDPLTNSQLRTRALAPNRGLRDAIEEWLLGTGLTHDQADDLPVTAGPRPAALGMLTSGSPTDPGGPPTAPAAGPEASQQAGVRVDPCKLWDAAEAGDVGALRRVLASGVDVDARDEDGTTALHFAAAHGHVEAVRVLLAAGASKDAARPDGATPLFFAAWYGHTDTVVELLSVRPDIDACREDGINPLMAAAMHGHLDTVRVLVAAGANLEARDRCKGKTAREWAKRMGHKKIAQLLKI